MIIKEWNAIKKRQLAPVYLLYGDEEYLLHETKQLLIRHVISEEEMDFNFSLHDLADEASLEAAIEDAESFPFMGEKRLVFIDGAMFYTAEKKKESRQSTEVLETYLESPAPYTVLVIHVPSEKLDERKKITKLTKKNATVIEAKKLTVNDIKGWIKSKVADHRLQIEDEAVEKLTVLAGTNLFMLAGEIEKLALYAEGSDVIRVEDVTLLTPKSVEHNVFDLIEHTLNGRTAKAIDLYHDLIRQKEEPLKLLALLSGQFRLIYQVKNMSGKGFSQQQIASRLKVHPFRVKLAGQHASRLSNDHLKTIMLELADCDLALKSSSGRKEMILEMFLTKLPGFTR
ncbi:DNA polymerase III subunit delta [Jeotgalibacillus haloalkalitolerans]|uniref:DNA polymerase III subunit delta n=1 Tax=Jeotgalibacillus haloalkalitolerans TaxID=3104292 RepID=A0ABU5KM90_9BACL|nr:DNA polymerase III subunit delta [Jeotgalibacillus sp. HH7-29]MDZ5712285.1 DNA polymerase III subunit delta [Jeotgalibacillus sp. HH7-29]